MSGFTKQFAGSLGVSVDDQTLNLLSDHFNETLLQRVSESVVDYLDDEQIKQLASLQDRSDPRLWDWLQENVPELNTIIKDEIDILLGELAEHSDKL